MEQIIFVYESYIGIEWTIINKRFVKNSKKYSRCKVQHLPHLYVRQYLKKTDQISVFFFNFNTKNSLHKSFLKVHTSAVNPPNVDFTSVAHVPLYFN